MAEDKKDDASVPSSEVKASAEAAAEKSKGNKQNQKEFKETLSILEKTEKAQKRINAEIAASTTLAREMKTLGKERYKAEVSLQTILGRMSEIDKDGIKKAEELTKKKAKLLAYEQASEKKAQKARQDLTNFLDITKKEQDLKLENLQKELTRIIQINQEGQKNLEAQLAEVKSDEDKLRIQQEINRLKADELSLNQQMTDAVKEHNKKQEEELSNLSKKDKHAREQAERFRQRVMDFDESLTLEEHELMLLHKAKQEQQETIKSLEKEKKLRELINARMGITGGVAKLAHAALDKMGMGMILNMEELSEEMERAAANGATKLEIMGVVGKHAMKKIGEALNDPLVVFTAIYKIFSSVVKAATAYQQKMFDAAKTLGISVQESTKLVQNFQSIADSNASMALTGKEMLESYAGMSDSLGFLASTNQEFLTTTTGLQRRFGFAAEEMAEMQLYAKETGKDLKSSFNSIVGASKAQGAKLKIAISEKQVMKEISKTSATILANFKGNLPALAGAIVKATKLGVTLEQMNTAGKSMLDFESSIAKEFEAQLLTGKNINLAKAREYALTGQTEKLMGEITSQIGSQADWSKMNVLQQESLAEAMGMSKEAVDEMFKKQSLANALGKDAAADAATQYNTLKEQGKSHEEIAKIMGAESAQQALNASVQEKAAAAQERLANAFEKASAMLLPIIESITDWITGIENLEGKMKAILIIGGSLLTLFIGYKTVMFALNAQAKIKALMEGKSKQTQAQANKEQIKQGNTKKKIEKDISKELDKQVKSKRTQLKLDRESSKLAKGKVNSARQQNTQETLLNSKKKAGNVTSKAGAIFESVKAGGAAAAASAGPTLGFGSLAIGAAVVAGLTALLSLAGEGSPSVPSGGGGGGGASAIEPVNAIAEANKRDSAPKSMGRSAGEKSIQTYIYVEPVTGKAVQKQAGQEHFADAQKIVG